jgi:hypothetical protein
MTGTRRPRSFGCSGTSSNCMARRSAAAPASVRCTAQIDGRNMKHCQLPSEQSKKEATMVEGDLGPVVDLSKTIKIY